MTFPVLAEVAALVARTAREELLPRFAAVQRHVKHDGSLVTEADVTLQARLQRELHACWPRFGLLGEEMPRAEQEALLAAEADGLWCLDPLDGTSNFAAGIPFFSVSLALLVGGRPALGLVYDPVRDECFSAEAGSGAKLNGSALTSAPAPADLRHSIACVDFKRLERGLAARVAAAPPFGSQRNFGSSALEWCWLADSRFHLYLHGGQKLWDYAAGWLVLTEAGGSSATLAGHEGFFAQIDSRSVVAARTSALFAPWQQWVAAQGAGS